MSMRVKVSPKYQVVIPESIRKILGITPGTHVDVLAKGGIIHVVPILELSDIQKEFAGKLDSKNLREKKDRRV